MGPHRVHRVRRPARAYRAATAAVRPGPGLAGGGRVRGWGRGRQPAARPGLHPARDLLRVAAAGRGRSTGRRPVLHRARPDRDPRAWPSLFLAAQPPGWVSAVALGAGAAVPAVAVAAAIGLAPASWRRAGTVPASLEVPPAAAEPAAGSAGSPAAARARAVIRAAHLRWIGYLVAGGAAARPARAVAGAGAGGSGLIEVAVRAGARARPPGPPGGPAGHRRRAGAGGRWRHRDRGWAGRAGLGGVQGRRAVLRRRVS